MERRQVPNTKIEVSTLCLGTMTFGNPVRERDAAQLVHWAIDHGINFFDTADMYEGYDRRLGSPGGAAERILGSTLRRRRDEVAITTKVGSAIGDGKYCGSGLGRNHIHHQIDGSLARLKTGCVDFYLLHKPDPDTPLAESIETMAELIRVGKVRHWGFSNFDAARIWEMLELCERNGWPRPVISQPPYSWLNRDAGQDTIPLCADHGIAVTPYQPLQGGLLTGKYRRGEAPPRDSRAIEHGQWLTVEDAVFDKLEQFEAEARGAKLSPAQYAIRWLLDQPGITSAVVGAKRIEQLEELLPACP